MSSAEFAHQLGQGSAPSPELESPPIDSVAIKMAAGYNVMTPRAWQDRAAKERFKLVKARRVVFMSNGVSVPPRAALRWLSEHLGEEGAGP